MRNTQLLIYRLGLIFTFIGIGCGIAAFIVMQGDALLGLLFAVLAVFFVGFGVDFIVKRSTEDVTRLVNFLFKPGWEVTGTPPFRNPDDKSSKKWLNDHKIYPHSSVLHAGEYYGRL